ncbi:EAL domain-containing protein [Hydrogenimonas sp.]
MEHKEPLISLRQLVLRTLVLLIFLSLLFEAAVGYLLKERALNNLAIQEARHISELIFENLYTKMQEGWSKNDIEKILARLNHVRDGMRIRLYRSKLVEEKYGVIAKDRRAVEKDPLIREAMAGQEVIRVNPGSTFRYLYPIRVEKRCLQCHDNAEVGDINGVLDIEFPAKQIVVSLDRMVFYFIAALTLFLLLFFLFFYGVFNRRLVRPLVAFSREIEKIDVDSDRIEPVKVLEKSNCQEMRTLEESFNALIGKIRYYYDRLIDSFLVDPLTGLGNLNRLKQEIGSGGPVSMALVNIDRFKELNDYYGFEMGDMVLKDVASHLKRVVPPDTRLYRIGGSEFALVRGAEFEVAEIVELLAELHNLSFEKRRLEELRITMTAGVVQMQSDRLIEKASIALSAAKQRNKPFEFYRNARELEIDYKRHIRWMQEVEEAIAQERVVLHYQPIEKVGEPHRKRYEALVRIVDRDGGIHLPGEFLDVVLHSRLYAKITRIVVEKAFETFRHGECHFSLNLSINDIKDPMCRNYVYESLHRYERPERVTFEILESEEVSDFETLDEFVRMVHSLGAKIAIDDFGSGYSNFHYLLKMKADYFKIDASLIRHIHEDPDSRILVESIVQFARRIGIETVAEYVENEEIARMCVELGIDYLQGYHIGRPSPMPLGC